MQKLVPSGNSAAGYLHVMVPVAEAYVGSDGECMKAAKLMLRVFNSIGELRGDSASIEPQQVEYC